MRKIFETTRFVQFRDAFSQSYRGAKKGFKEDKFRDQTEKIWNRAVYLMGNPASLIASKPVDPYGRLFKRKLGYVESK